MNRPTFSQRVYFLSYVSFPFAVVMIMLAFLYGCQQKKEPPKEQLPTITLDNLQTAYAKAVRYNFMYSKFAPQALKEKNKDIYNLYLAIARSEQVHADQHAALMRSKGIEPKQPTIDSVSVGTMLQTLKMALSSEEIETESMYPNIMRSAEAEKFTAASEQFKFCMDGDQRQADLLKDAQDHNGKIKIGQLLVCPVCGYIFTSKEAEECPTCKTKQDKFIVI